MSENKQDITQLRQRLAQSTIIVDATRRFTSTLDSDEIRLALFEAAFQIVGAQQIALHLINEQGLQSIICHPMEGLRIETAVLPPEATAFRICEDVEQVIWHRDDADHSAPPISVEAVDPFDSYLALPLKGADHVVGVIEAFNLLEPQNAAQQAALMVEIAGPAGLAIYNGMLYQEAQHEITERKRVESEVRQQERMLAKRAAQLETVSRVSTYTSTILEPDKLLQEVVNLTKDQFELYHVHIYLVNEAGDKLDLVVGAGDVGRQMVAQGRSIPLQQKQSLVAQVARSVQGLIENDVLNNPAFLSHPLLPDTRSETAVPVISRGRVIGVLDVQSDRVDMFTEQDVQIQTMLAAHIAVALENARSYEQAVTSLVETEALLDITKETSHVLELASITNNVLDKVLTATNFDAGLITVVDPNTQKLEVKSHRLPEQFWNMLQENGLDGTLCDLVYRRRESVVVVDMAADAPVDVTGLLSLGYKSYQGVPLESQGEVLGTLCLFSRQSLTSDNANSVFLQAVGRQVGIAIRNVALLEQEQKALSEAQQSRQLAQEYLDMQRVLHEINIELFRIDDLHELYHSAIELAHTRLGFERVGMYMLNESNDLLLGTYGVDAEGNICDERGPEYVIDQKETIDTFVLNRTRLVVDEDVDLWYSGEVMGRGWHIGAAMWAEDSPIGVIFADNLLTGQPLKSYQAELLFAYARMVSNLIQRNRFETIITKRAAEMQAVAEVGTAAATILATDKLLQEVVDMTKDSFDLYHAHIYLINKETETLVLTSGAGAVGRQMVAEGRRIPLKQEQSLVARSARSRQGVVINDVQSEPGFLPHPLLPDTRAEMAVPLITGEQVLGVLDVQSERLNYFTKEDIHTFTTLAAQMAVALQNARLFTQSEERAEELAFVNRIVTEINTLDTKTGLQFMAEELGEILQIPSIVIGLIDNTGTMLEMAAARHPAGVLSPVGSVFPVAGDPVMSQALQTRQTVVVEDVANSDLPPQARKMVLETGTRSMYVIPMVVGRDLVGTVSLNVMEGGDLLTPDQLNLAETTVYQAATAVQNARLFTQSEERETLLRTIIDATPDWIFVKDEEHRYRLVNKGYADALHIAPEDFVGKDDLELGFPEDLVKGDPEKGIRGFWADDRLVMESGEMQVYPNDPATIDGEVHTFHTIKAPLRDADGPVWGVLAFARDITEREQAEEALRRSEADLSEALKITKLGYWEYDVENDLFTFNDQFYALFHTTAKEHGGYQLSSAYYAQHFVHPDDLHMVGGEIERGLNSTDRHYSHSLEHRILYADGGVGYISVNINIDRDENGKILRNYGANQDITERKRAEEILRRSEAELSEALKIAKLAYWEYDVEKDLFTFNDQFFALFHTTAEEHGGYQLPSAYYAQHFVYPDDLPMVGAEIERALNSTDQHYNRLLEHRILYADGGVGYITVNINIDRDGQGNILRYYGANQDITERKLFEEAIQKEQERVQVILESINVPFAVTRVSDGKVIYCNEALGDLVGVPHEKLVGQGMPDFYANPSDRVAYVSQLREQGFVTNFDLHMKRADSQQYWALLSGRLIDFQGEPAIITFALDVTERREAQATIARRATELETVANVSTVTATILEPEELLQQVVDLTKERFDLYHAHIYLLDEDMSQLTLSNGAGEVGRTMVAEGRQIALNQEKSLVARAARDKKGVVINDVQAETGFLPHPLLPDTRAEMAVPLIAKDEVLGVLDVQADSINRFMEEDINIFTTLAAQIATAVQNALLFTQSEERETLMRTIIDSTPDWIFVKDVEHRYLMVNQGYADVFHAIPDEFIGKNDLDMGFPEELVKGNPEKGIRGFWADDREIMDSGEVKVFDVDPAMVDGEVHFFNTIKAPLRDAAGNVAGVVGFARDITDRLRFEEELQIVAELSTTVATTLEQEKLLQEVVDLTCERFNFYHAQIYLFNVQQDTLVLAFGAGDVGRKLVARKHQIGLNVPQSLVVQAARSGQAVVVNDVRENPDWLPNELLPETQAEMAVPMMVGNRVVGVLDVQSGTVNRFTDQDVQIQTTLAAQVSIALENARSFEQAQTAVSEMNALTRRLTREGWQEYLAEKTVEQVGFIYNPVELNPVSPIHKSVTNGTGTQNQSVNVADPRQFDRPIHVLGEKIGQLSIVPDEDKSDVDSELAEIMNAVTERLSGHLENLRLTERTQIALSQTEQQAERLSMLNEMGAELSRADMLDEILEIGVNHTAKILLADRVTLGMLTPEREHIEFVAVWGEDERVQSGVIVPIEMNKTMKTAVQENRVIADNNATLEAFSDVKSFMTAPLAGDNRVIGVINVGNLHAYKFTNQDQSLVLQISSLLGAAIERQRLTELTRDALNETQRRSEELALINRVMAAVTGSLDLTLNMQIIAKELAQAISVAHVGIALMTDDQNYLEVVTEYPMPEPGSLEDSIGEQLPVKGYPLTEKAMETRKFAVAYDAQNNPLTAPIHDLLRKRNIATLAVLPMALGDEIFGTVGFDILDPDRIVTDEQMRLAETIVYHTTTVVQNARLFAQTQQRLADLTVIQQAVSDLTVAQSTHDALSALTPKMMSAVDADSVSIYTIEDQHLMRLIQYPEWNLEVMEMAEHIPIDRFAPIYQAIQKHQIHSLSVDDPELDSETKVFMEAANIDSSAVVPLVSQEGVTGVLLVHMHHQGKRFSGHDTNLLQTLANQASIALDRIRLLEETRQRARREQLLREIAAKVRSTTQVDNVMRTAVQEIGRALGRKTFLYLDSAKQEQNPEKDA